MSRYSPQERKQYQDYINSPLWRQRKAQRITMSGGCCDWLILVNPFTQERVRCQRRTYLCVHHNTYERLGNELATDLDVYCWFHHMLEHMMWKKCPKCLRPVLVDELSAAKWLTAILGTRNIDLDTGKPDWKCLPTKSELLDIVPTSCVDCESH